MPITLGLDIGTTTISAVAVDLGTGQVQATVTLANDAECTSAEDRGRGRSEWDAGRMAEAAVATVRECVGRLGEGTTGGLESPRHRGICGLESPLHAADSGGTEPHRHAEVVGIGVTGQQHGVVLVDAGLRPVSPFINWQDRRGEEQVPGECCSYSERAAELAGPDAARTSGCTLSTGYMGTTLFWLRATGELPEGATACYAADYVASALTGCDPVTDPTNGASSGLFDLRARTWDDTIVARLGLPRAMLPEVREAGELLGGLSAEAANATGLPAGLPVFVGLGDNQASFLGSVADLRETVLVNVGTGAQVGCFAEMPHHAPPLETRPFARGGYLLVHNILSGGRSYALLHRFFAQVASELLGVEAPDDLYERMNGLAAGAPAGSDGLLCEPYFAGSREDPDRRACLLNASDLNFTPQHLTRSLLEGLARSLLEGCDLLQGATGQPRSRLVGAGNGLRRNAVLSHIVAEAFGMPLRVPTHREEAAYGAALVAGVGAGVFADIEAAAQVVRYQDT